MASTIPRVVVAGATFMVLASTALAEPEQAAEPVDARAFLEAAARGGMAEVDLGKLAQERGSNVEVKRFGARMAADHGKANIELAALAKRKGVMLPESADQQHLALRDRLSKLSGDAFDRAYMHEMKTDHEHDVAEFLEASESANDADVRTFASDTLPTLKEHLDEAQRLDRALNGNAAREVMPMPTSSQAAGAG
jgi:putative membrane protein